MLIELSKLSQYNQNTETQRKSNSGETIFLKKLSFLYTLVKEVKRRKSLSKKIIKHESLWILESNTAQKAWINLPSQPEVAIMRNKDIYGPLGSVSWG